MTESNVVLDLIHRDLMEIKAGIRELQHRAGMIETGYERMLLKLSHIEHDIAQIKRRLNLSDLTDRINERERS